MRCSTFAAVLALLSIPSLASALAGNDDANVVHACIGNGSNIVRIVDVNGSCREAETPHTRAIQGPQGAPGIDGTNGAAGINGTNGANGTNGIDGKDGAAGPAGPPGPAGAACLPTDPACVGPQGETGPQGPQGRRVTRAREAPQDPAGRRSLRWWRRTPWTAPACSAPTTNSSRRLGSAPAPTGSGSLSPSSSARPSSPLVAAGGSTADSSNTPRQACSTHPRSSAAPPIGNRSTSRSGCMGVALRYRVPSLTASGSTSSSTAEPDARGCRRARHPRTVVSEKAVFDVRARSGLRRTRRRHRGASTARPCCWSGYAPWRTHRRGRRCLRLSAIGNALGSPKGVTTRAGNAVHVPGGNFNS